MTTRGWRRTWFQVHKWIGLALAILVIPLCVSGAALVWGEALDHAVNPARYTVSGETLLSPARYVEAARARLRPGDRLAQMTMPEAHGPVIVAASPAGATPRPGPPLRISVYLDPPTARVLDVSHGGGLVRFLHVLHGSLQLPGIGRTIVGWIGVAMMISAFTGLWLWWPTVGRWARGLRWRRHRNLDTNLHHLLGFWVAVPLFVLSLTGAWIAFPAFFGTLTGEGGLQVGERMAMRAPPAAMTRLSLTEVLARAGALGGGELKSVAWPTERKPDWTIVYRGQGAPTTVAVADDAGTAVPAPTQQRGGSGIAGIMRRVHDGTGMGPLWQAILFLTGIVPAALAVTGVVMWWRARGWRAELQQRRGRVAAAE